MVIVATAGYVETHNSNHHVSVVTLVVAEPAAAVAVAVVVADGTTVVGVGLTLDKKLGLIQKCLLLMALVQTSVVSLVQLLQNGPLLAVEVVTASELMD